MARGRRRIGPVLGVFLALGTTATVSGEGPDTLVRFERLLSRYVTASPAGVVVERGPASGDGRGQARQAR